jgi:hypothetical protein
MTRSMPCRRSAFNDRARSVAVLAGQWEVCQHSDFTGRCVFLRYDVPDLAWYGHGRRDLIGASCV